MIIKYLDSKSWNELTREERYFCAELFFEVRNNPEPFLKLIDKDSSSKFEVAYEVCFYRDYSTHFEESIKESNFSQKRTFDLALLSDKELIIVEAKSHGGFDNKQLTVFKKDFEDIKSIIKRKGFTPPDIYYIGIHSSKYSPKESTRNFFHKLITWNELKSKYKSSESVFLRADEIYNY